MKILSLLITGILMVTAEDAACECDCVSIKFVVECEGSAKRGTKIAWSAGGHAGNLIIICPDQSRWTHTEKIHKYNKMGAATLIVSQARQGPLHIAIWERYREVETKHTQGTQQISISWAGRE